MIEPKESIRPLLENISNTADKKAEEKFQNLTLRPIIKMQHDLLVAFFENYLTRKKIDLTVLSTAKRQEVVSGIFKNDNSLKTEIRGLIIGHFTVTEYNAYLPIASDVNKRILTMIKERLLSVVPSQPVLAS